MSKGVDCKNADCEGKVTWIDGTPYKHGLEGVTSFTMLANSGADCSGWRPKLGQLDERSSCSINLQYICKLVV